MPVSVEEYAIQRGGPSRLGEKRHWSWVNLAALGVGCDYCHVLGRWDSDEKPAKVTARLMLRMFDEIPHYFEEGHQPVMQCYTCHQGSPKPEREPKG